MALLTCNKYLSICEGFAPQLEPITGPLITKPDDALSIVEIITRYSRGIPLPVKSDALFDEDVDLMLEDDHLQALSDVYDAQEELKHGMKVNAEPAEAPLSEAEQGSTEHEETES